MTRAWRRLTLTFGLRALGAQVKAYLLLVLRAIEESGKADPTGWVDQPPAPDGPAGPAPA